MRGVISFIFAILSFLSFLMLIGVAGGIECDAVTLEEGTGKMIIWLLSFGVCALLAKVVGVEE